VAEVASAPETAAETRPDGRTIARLWRDAIATPRTAPAYVVETPDGWQPVSWTEAAERVEDLAYGFLSLGIGRGDVVAIIGRTTLEWVLADFALARIGAVSAAIYPTSTAPECRFLLDHSEAVAVLVEQEEHRSRVEGCGALTRLRRIVDFEEFGDLERSGREHRAHNPNALEQAEAEIREDDPFTYIYTSGTTGPPKGVQITHNNIVSAVRGFEDVIDFPVGAQVVSYLPMAHIAERSTGHYIPIVLGHTVTCCPNPREVIGYLPEVRPSWFFAVPRIWEKLKAGLEAMIEGEQDAERKRALKWAIELGHKKVRLEQARKPVPDELRDEHEKADRMVLSKLREQLGLDKLEAVYVGAAPTPMAVLEFFHAIGVPVAELWGLSESCGSGTVNLPHAIKLGTVGQVAPNMELKLGEDGEVLIRGPQIMKGYRNMPEKTEEAIDAEGWLHTGDIGELDDEGYLKIVDRKKELIINAAGKNISPANLEAKLKAHALIGTACVIGDGRPYLTALIVLDTDIAPVWAAGQGIEDTSLDALAESEAVRAEVQRGVDDVNSQVSQVEGIKKFTVLGTDWLPGGDELTPTMKLKRKPVAAKYASQIEAMYAK
jgi:long-subunit acyl-CoA synthetase (AMP-forming)